MNNKCNVKRTDVNATIPCYADSGACAFDLKTIEDVIVHPGEVVKIRTGCRFSIPKNTAALLMPRSGLSLKYPNYLANNIGLCDESYRGEYLIPFVNNINETITIEKGTKLAQVMIIPYVRVEFEEVNNLDETERGEGGFNSTGTK